MGQTVVFAPLMLEWASVLQTQRTARVMEWGCIKSNDFAQAIQDLTQVGELLRFGQISLRDCMAEDTHRMGLHMQLRRSQSGFLMNFAIERRGLLPDQRKGWREFHDLVDQARAALLGVVASDKHTLDGVSTDHRNLLIELSSWLVRQVPPPS